MSSTGNPYPNYSPGLEGVVAGISRISDIDSDRSSLQYRGYDVHDLAEHGCFEETAFLLIHGHLPNATELSAFKARLGGEREVPSAIYSILREIPKEAHPMDMIRTAFSAIAAFDPDYHAPSTDHDANVRKAERIIAKAGTMVANGHRIRLGLDPMKPDPEMGVAESMLYLMDGSAPDAKKKQVMDASLTLYAEHGYNASTFANRVTVATLSDVYSGVV